MRKFLSAIVKQDGEIICRPDVTDSHEDLIDFAGLVDDGRDAFVRLEFLPKDDDFADVAAYTLVVDQTNTPDWFDDAMKERVEQSLRDRVRRMIVADDRKILLGGCWIVVDGAKVRRTINATLRIVGGEIKQFSGGRIALIYGGEIKQFRGGTIALIYGGTIEHLVFGTIEQILGGEIKQFYGGTIALIYGGEIERIYGGTIKQRLGGEIKDDRR